MSHTRLRDLGIQIGSLPPGPLNAMTDVPGVLVGMSTLIADHPSVARTGVTVIFPRLNVHQDAAIAGFHSFNGIGDMTGLPFIEETGLLTKPILLTNTNQIGLGYETVIRYGAQHHGGFAYKLPVVAETYDGWLNDINSFPLKEEHFVEALENAHSGEVAEGNTGGGTGMICYDFKGGTGTASRVAEVEGNRYTIGALVQANHGDREHLMVAGVPVGRTITKEVVPSPWQAAPGASSIIIILATDAPLLAEQCRRLAQRATVGLARTGGYGLVGSGDLFLAFSTGNHDDPIAKGLKQLTYVPHFSMDSLIVGAAEAAEEAILNALVAAETMTGYKSHTAHRLPHDLLVQAVNKS